MPTLQRTCGLETPFNGLGQTWEKEEREWKERKREAKQTELEEYSRAMP